MATKCYAQVRGSALRVTGLGDRGEILTPTPSAVSKAVVSVTINEITETGGSELLRTDEDEARLHFVRPTQLIRNTVDVDFLRVDPGVLTLVSGVPVVRNAAGEVVGFDSKTRVPATSFALEVWSKLAGNACEGGQQEWGYTLLPFLRGGYLSGFRFENNLISFNLRGAKTRREPRWGVGPHDLQGPFERLTDTVSRTTTFKNVILPAPPPAQTEGVQTSTDIIDNGTADNPMPDPSALLKVDGGSAQNGPWIIEGGRAL